ncbi:response regulator transcription factor [uncultured Thiodictyon sp.]|jgi:DNA-binding NarL/FixJ family response regulator|uniref:response regulator transcription factor n=1 Tax=uncultured Thiodictyon sp. TaxID=1846217 RepID=UPI0025D77C59|nr:response regulator transcription factor [uncultured Thiodictyon sp.]
MTIRVVLADDHIMVRDALVGMLSAEPDLAVVGVAADGYEALAQAQYLRPDVLLLDLNMPNLNGIETAARVRKAVLGCRVIALSALGDACFVKQMVAAGARGYLDKSASLSSLAQAVRQVHGGGTWLPETLPPPAQPARALLSRREREVLAYIAAGQRGSQIAQVLRVAVKTVDTYRRRMMTKLGLQSQTERIEPGRAPRLYSRV